MFLCCNVISFTNIVTLQTGSSNHCCSISRLRVTKLVDVSYSDSRVLYNIAHLFISFSNLVFFSKFPASTKLSVSDLLKHYQCPCLNIQQNIFPHPWSLIGKYRNFLMREKGLYLLNVIE